jgi:2-haloacid dehalogenase
MSRSRAPEVAVFDVNETLSDLAGLDARLKTVGADPAVRGRWFASTLRDGFAITAAGGEADFSAIAVSTLAAMLKSAEGLRAAPEDAANHVVEGMAELDLHPDVAAGMHMLADAGVRLVTLSNGAARVADSLLARAGLRDLVEDCLSVANAGRWKPAPESYAYAARRLGVPAVAMALIAVHPWDINGACRAGLRTGWISRDGADYPPFMRRPDVGGRDLPEVAHALLQGRRS